VDRPSVIKQLTVKPDLDDVRYASGAVMWRVDRKNVTRSGMIKLVGTSLYKQMTIRNCNTTRKLLELMEGQGEERERREGDGGRSGSGRSRKPERSARGGPRSARQ
jgi:hypothetical protein